MSITLTLFIGARDPNLMGKLNSCQTACCLIDPDDISEYEGYLPTFLGEERERILSFSRNIFTQYPEPGFEFVIDEHVSSEQETYRHLEKKLQKDFEDQLEDIEQSRLFQEIELQNALINFPSLLMGAKVSELQGQLNATTAFVLWSKEISPSLKDKLIDVQNQVLIIASLSSLEGLAENGIMPSVIVAAGEDKLFLQNQEAFYSVPLVADVTSSPASVKNFEHVYWCSCPHFLDLDEEHKEYVDFESQWSGGRDSRLLALSVALHLNCSKVFLNTTKDPEFKEITSALLKESASQSELLFLDETKDVPIQGDGVEVALSLSKVYKNVATAKKFISEIEKDIDSEREGEVLHSVLRACDHDTLIKMGNGFINYGLINYQESDLSKKKSYFLSVVRELKKILEQPDLNEAEYRQQVSQIFAGKELFWDFGFEVKVLAHSNPRLSLVLERFHRESFIPKEVRFSFAHKFKVDLELNLNGTWSLYEAPILNLADLDDKAINENGIIIVAGLLDGRVQLDLFEMYPDVPIVTLVNKPEYMAELIKYVPLVSLLGRRGLWVHGENAELAEAYKTLLGADHVQPIIVDPDPEGKCSYLRDFKKILDI